MAKKTKEEATGKTKLDEALESLNKKYGTGTVLTLESKPHTDYDVISTGSIGFDYITLGTGGFVKGKLYELMGWEGCLAEDTFIKFITVRPDGVVQDCKGGTIKNLYTRFHTRNDKTKDSEFNIISINEGDRVFRNKIADVVKSGVKECFEVITKKGFKIKTTKDHKFYTKEVGQIGTKFLPLSELMVGSTVFIHNNTPFSKNKKNRRKYEETTIKWYYKGKPKVINGYTYYRERVSRLTYEAHMNNISYSEYKENLDKWNKLPNDWWTIPEGYDIHHIDENTQNDDISNLELMDKTVHARLHALDKHNNLRFMVIPDEIKSISSIGEVETYDIKCYYPYNNFIAEGIVVHNSGKSTICGHAAAECQKKGGKVVYIDGEHAVDKTYFQSLGVDTKSMLLAQPSSGEEGFNIAMQLIESGEVDLLIIDSDSSLIPQAVVDGEVGDSSIGKKARLNNSAYPKLKTVLAKNKVCVIVISQYREKIGVMFGNPTTTQGGHALKYYTDCRIEVTKSLAKEGDVNYGNLTKVKTVKNKMFPPYQKSEFEVLYGKGIDRLGEIMQLADSFGIVKKRGKTITWGDNKYQDDEFRNMLINPEFTIFQDLKSQIVDKIQNTEIEVEEPTETE